MKRRVDQQCLLNIFIYSVIVYFLKINIKVINRLKEIDESPLQMETENNNTKQRVQFNGNFIFSIFKLMWQRSE